GGGGGLLPGVLRRARSPLPVDSLTLARDTPFDSLTLAQDTHFDSLTLAQDTQVTPIDKIYLVGFMAAGKSTVAKLLGARLGWRAEDIYVLIEARERATVADIFSRHGEPYFRACERDILRILLPLRHTVVATGG